VNTTGKDRNPESDMTSEPQPALETIRIKRPFSVTVLMVGVLLITVLNIIRFLLSISYFGFLNSRLAISPIYLVMTGFVWGLGGLCLFWSLWKVKSWAPMLMQAIALTYALYFWLDWIFLSEHPVSGAPSAVGVLLPGSWVFSAGITVIALAYVAWIMNRAKVKLYFSSSDSRDNPSQEVDIDEAETNTAEY
jgi:hypothetical protein